MIRQNKAEVKKKTIILHSKVKVEEKKALNRSKSIMARCQRAYVVL